MADRLDPALETFVSTEYQRLVGMLALYLGDRWVAEEVAQDAIVRLCQHWPRVRGMENGRAWLNKVAMNLARSWFRRKYAERRALVRHGPDPDTVATEWAVPMAVREAVSSLPARQRSAVVLRYFSGLSVRETADAMSCAEGTVKALTHRAINALRGAGLTDEPEGVPHGA